MQGSSSRGQTTAVDKPGTERAVARRQYFDPTWGFGGDLFRMSPFGLLRMMTEQMDREFSGFYPERAETAARPMWAPALELKEKDGHIVVSADLPGIDLKDIKVEVVEDMLTISGERKHEHEERKGGWHRTERSYGSFYRAVQLPQGAKTEQLKAVYNNGVLEVTVPVEQPKENRKQIPIQAGGAKPIETTVKEAPAAVK